MIQIYLICRAIKGCCDQINLSSCLRSFISFSFLLVSRRNFLALSALEKLHILILHISLLSVMSLPVGFSASLPSKFDGSSQSISSWSRAFRDGCDLLSLDGTQSLKVFRIWLAGPAADWLTIRLRDSSTTDWTVKEWLEALETNYAATDVSSQASLYHTMEGLAGFRPGLSEPMNLFHARFRSYLGLVPRDHYTPVSVKMAYSKTLGGSHLTRIRWNLHTHSDFEKWTLDQCMRFVETLAATDASLKALDASTGSPSVAPVILAGSLPVIASPHVGGSTVADPMQSAIALLTKQVGDLTLLVQKGNLPRPRDNTRMTCFNCGIMGHSSAACSLPPNPELKNKLISEFRARQMVRETTSRTQTESALLLATRLPSATLMNATHKRIRVDDLLNNTLSPEETPRAVSVPVSSSPGIVKPRPSPRLGKLPVVKSDSVVAKLLDSPAPISWREYLKMKPKSVASMIEALSHVAPRKKRVMLAVPGGDLDVADSSSESEEEADSESPINSVASRPAGTSYVLVKIGVNRIPLFVDVGASCCV